MVEIVKQNLKENRKKFNTIKIKLQSKLGKNIKIEHVGSTTIPNMYGKNIIDILIGVKDINEFKKVKEILKESGFIESTRNKDEKNSFFASKKEETKSGDIHIHLAIKTTKRYKDFILLKNYLLNNKDEVKEYSELKRYLVNNNIKDREEYKKVKSLYVTKLIKRAKKNKINVNYEYVDPFNEKYDYLLRIEHLGRYYLALDTLKGFNKVLDVACADGYGTKILSKGVKKIIGIDKNEKYLNIAKNKYGNENIIYKKIDLDNKEITGKYDGIVCLETIEHLKFPEKFLKNLYSILDKEGTLILSFPNSNYEIIENGKNKDLYHINIFKYNDMIKLINKIGFKIEKTYGQAYINKIVNKKIIKYKLTNIVDDAKTIGYQNEEEIKETYSYIIVLKK